MKNVGLCCLQRLSIFLNCMNNYELGQVDYWFNRFSIWNLGRTMIIFVGLLIYDAISPLCAYSTQIDNNVISNNAGIQRFISFATNCPNINNLILQIRVNPKANIEYYQFIYQSNAFLGRRIHDTNNINSTLCLEDEMCGRYNDLYWYYNNDKSTRPVLYVCVKNESNPRTMAFTMQKSFLHLLGAFQSHGLSFQGVNSAIWNIDHFEEHDNDRKVTNISYLMTANGVVNKAVWNTVIYNKTKTMPQYYEYNYDTNIFPMGIPTGLVMNTNEFIINVMHADIRPKSELASSNMFLPSLLFDDTNLARVTYSNGSSTLNSDGRISPFKRNHNWYQFNFLTKKVIIYIILGLFLFSVWHFIKHSNKE